MNAIRAILQLGLIGLPLWVGCGEADALPAAPDFVTDPEPEAEPAPEVYELRCDLYDVAAGRLYFYAQTEAPDWSFEVFVCTEQTIPVLPPVCAPTDAFSVRDGVFRALCGEWGEPIASFVRVAEVGVEPVQTVLEDR